MIYRFAISTPANTNKANRIKTSLPLARGIIHQIEVQFPPGPQALLHLKLNRGLHQIWPTNSETAFSSDNTLISFREHFEIIDRPFRLEAYTWNDDTAYAHLVIVRIGILPRKFILRRLF